MGNKLLELEGLGLAAPQLGLPFNFFVIRSNPVQGFFNATIVDHSEEEVLLEEGCLSYPGLVLKIKRPRNIKVRAFNPEGVANTYTFQDMTARIIQHEIDHINGVVFTDKVSRLQLEMAIKKASKSGHTYKIGDLYAR
jgi:peptide deformylase